MKKLRLDLDNLKVESFVTTPAMAGPPGTVHGQSPSNDLTGSQECCGDSTPDTCGVACVPTREGQHSCGGYTECCNSTVACTSIDTQDCGGCGPDTDYQGSCTDQGCSGCGGAC